MSMCLLRSSLDILKNTVLKVLGLTEKLNQARPILGYSDTETVMLDLDDTAFRVVKYWALRTMKWFKLGGFIILKSSEKCYHVVYNRKVSWSENMRIVAWVALLSRIEKLKKWFLMQCIKESSTLRVSPKRTKSSPRIVYRHGRQDEQIRSFLRYRRKIKNMHRLRMVS